MKTERTYTSYYSTPAYHELHRPCPVARLIAGMLLLFLLLTFAIVANNVATTLQTPNQTEPAP